MYLPTEACVLSRFVHLFMSSSLNVFAETIGCVKDRIKSGCDVIGFIDSDPGCLVEALRGEKGRGGTGFFLCREAFLG